MAILDGVTLDRVDARSTGPLSWLVDVDVNGRLLEDAKTVFREDVWAFWRERKDEPVLTVTVAVVFRRTVRMRDLAPVLTRLVGPDPLEGVVT